MTSLIITSLLQQSAQPDRFRLFLHAQTAGGHTQPIVTAQYNKTARLIFILQKTATTM